MNGLGDILPWISANDIALFDAKVRQLATDVQAQAAGIPIPLFLDWTTFLVSWNAWHASNAGGTYSTLFTTPNELMAQFAGFIAQYNELRRRFLLIQGFKTDAAASGPTGDDETASSKAIKATAQVVTVLGITYIGFRFLPDLWRK
jgi:hypothetical protein